MFIAGIDEAGRGPCIGPMVMAIAVIDASRDQELKELGVKDSKLLKKEVREEMYPKIIDICDEHHVIVLDPSDIDEALNHPSNNLNKLEADTSVALAKAITTQTLIIDCPSTNVNKYAEYLRARLPKLKIVCEHKADENYLVCAAASILAKVTRDRICDELQKEFNIKFGSGYMTDPLTQEFLEREWQNPALRPLFRTSWESFKRLVRNKAQSRLGDF